ncbi:MAG TPA: serine/threonine-protein kinase [Gemmataceae bacterium]|nr:serine/threonine-protein kinase [Gemmataceae bacterium]
MNEPRPTSEPATASVPAVVGDYQLVRKLGEGSMGTVYKARQLSQERKVALKLLDPAMAGQPKLLQRFYREARVMIRLSHPRFVAGYEVGQAAGCEYFAMEYVSGVSLQDVRTHLSPLAVGDALHIIRACAEGLHFAHEIGLVHRDVKATNILLRKDGQVKITDLGMIKLLTDDVGMTRTGCGIGTPSYMPLEQARDGKRVDRRSDIYALGCLLYSLLTAQMPFRGNNLVELIIAKEAGTFVPARRLNRQVPATLDDILLRMLAKLPDDRYPSCAQLMADLDSLGLVHETLSFVPTKRGLLAVQASAGAPQELPTRTTPAPKPRPRRAARAKVSSRRWRVATLTGAIVIAGLLVYVVVRLLA